MQEAPLKGTVGGPNHNHCCCYNNNLRRRRRQKSPNRILKDKKCGSNPNSAHVRTKRNAPTRPPNPTAWCRNAEASRRIDSNTRRQTQNPSAEWECKCGHSSEVLFFAGMCCECLSIKVRSFSPSCKLPKIFQWNDTFPSFKPKYCSFSVKTDNGIHSV